MEYTKTNKRGISLIVLVITIIVMIILAGSIILTLNNNGIIGKASEAVEQTDKATLEEIASLAWAEAYAENAASNNKRTGTELENKLKEKIIEALETNGLDHNEYGMKVTTSGVKIVKGWMQDGITVTKGERTVNVGEFIEYDETAGRENSGLVNVQWQILGANDKGELLILSTDNVVENYELGSDTDLEEAQDDWLNIEAKLAEECKPYAGGRNATGARSIKLEDINKVRGFDPGYSANSGLTYKECEYGETASIYYNDSKSPLYEVTNGEKGNLTEHTNGLYYYNGKTIVKLDEELNKGKGLITTLKNSAYVAWLGDLRVNSWSESAQEMFYGQIKTLENEKIYWLANPCARLYGGCLEYGVMSVYAKENLVEQDNEIWNSCGYCDAVSVCGVRAVVSLDAKTVLKERTATGWTY